MRLWLTFGYHNLIQRYELLCSNKHFCQQRFIFDSIVLRSVLMSPLNALM